MALDLGPEGIPLRLDVPSGAQITKLELQLKNPAEAWELPNERRQTATADGWGSVTWSVPAELLWVTSEQGGALLVQNGGPWYAPPGDPAIPPASETKVPPLPVTGVMILGTGTVAAPSVGLRNEPTNLELSFERGPRASIAYLAPGEQAVLDGTPLLKTLNAAIEDGSEELTLTLSSSTLATVELLSTAAVEAHQLFERFDDERATIEAELPWQGSVEASAEIGDDELVDLRLRINATLAATQLVEQTPTTSTSHGLLLAPGLTHAIRLPRLTKPLAAFSFPLRALSEQATVECQLLAAAPTGPGAPIGPRWTVELERLETDTSEDVPWRVIESDLPLDLGNAEVWLSISALDASAIWAADIVNDDPPPTVIRKSEAAPWMPQSDTAPRGRLRLFLPSAEPTLLRLTIARGGEEIELNVPDDGQVTLGYDELGALRNQEGALQFSLEPGRPTSGKVELSGLVARVARTASLTLLQQADVE